MTGRMLRMAVLTVGQRGLYAVVPVHVVTRRRTCRGVVPPLRPGRCRSPHAVIPAQAGIQCLWRSATEKPAAEAAPARALVARECISPVSPRRRAALVESKRRRSGGKGGGR